jgi:hypothetical protein
MLLYILTIIWIVVSIVFVVVSACFYAAMTIMPYISGALISLFLCTEVSWAGRIVLGHSVMNYLMVLLVVEAVVAVLMNIKATGKATALSFSEIMIAVISMIALDAIKPDSAGYCVFVTVVYLILNFIFLVSNSSKYGDDQENSPAGIVISSLISAFSAYFVLAIPAELLWQKFIEVNHPAAMPAFTVIYWILRIAVCGGIVFLGISRARKASEILCSGITPEEVVGSNRQ